MFWNFMVNRQERRMFMLITIRQAAERLSVSTKTIYRRIKDGSLPAVKLSERDYRIDEKDLDAFIQKLKTA